MTIGIISEGVSDQETLTHILQSFTENKDLDPALLLPEADEPVGWGNVLARCRSEEFKAAFQFNDLVVVQLDTDWLRRDGVPEEWIIPGIHELTVEELVAVTRERLAKEIGEPFFTDHAHQIIFAIAVDEIECWFLALYDNKKASKTTGCLDALNAALAKSGAKFSIHEKKLEYYRQMCAGFKKKKDLLAASQHNPSFRLFLDELQTKLAAQPTAQTD